jgi:hypothetical protein
VLITNEFHEFCWSTISGTSDDVKASYGSKSMHIFNMPKIRHIHREYDMRGWCCAKPGPNRAKVEPAGPTSLAGWPARCWRLFKFCFGNVSRIIRARGIQCPNLVWPQNLAGRPPYLAGRPDKWGPWALLSAKALTQPPINTPILLLVESVKKVRFSFL